MAEDKCWFCQTSARMTRSHVLLHCPNAKLRAAREKAWEGKTPGGVRVLLANPRWERRLVKFLELSGDGRRDRRGWSLCRENGRVGGMGDGGMYSPQGRGIICVCPRLLYIPLLTFCCKGSSYPEICAQRTAKGGGSLMLE
jgi:hypothetical protein